LRPYFNRVTTIGSGSCGKPVGMNPINFCDMTLLAVNFASFNKVGEGDYFDGIPADCAAVDDVSRDFGDPLEDMLETALLYENTAACRAPPPVPSRPATEMYGLRAIAGAV
jgi:carboxyl-terminal processing protease